MMTDASSNALERRSFRVDQGGALRDIDAWYGGNLLSTQLLNAYTLLIPEGERYIIRTCSRFLAQVPPALRGELRNLFYQEGRHSREHARVLNAMRSAGLSLGGLRKPIEWFFYRLLEPCSPLKLRLSTAAAIEHHNAAIATYFLSRSLLEAARCPELRRLFLWHFAEELEHKESAFKLLQAVSRSWLLRASGLALSLATFIGYLVLATAMLAFKTGAVFRGPFWRELLDQCGQAGLPAAIVRASGRYLEPSFAPRLAESRALLSTALVELDRLGLRPCVDKRPTAGRAMPEAFRKRITAGIERVHRLQPDNGYFGASIAGYDGAWIKSQR
jgi:predicted metal-dependent hydrolase